MPKIDSGQFLAILLDSELVRDHSSLIQEAPRIRDELVPNQPNPSDLGHIRAESVRIYSGEFGSGVTPALGHIRAESVRIYSREFGSGVTPALGHIRAELVRIYSGEFGSGVTLA